mmetsp:Transcript_41056/g.120000  ORF Transcript_41056/g.120000 Transcript_41056/m.120000 type:complete len:244 (+) Transcript_41056:1905-2636(+)
MSRYTEPLLLYASPLSTILATKSMMRGTYSVTRVITSGAFTPSDVMSSRYAFSQKRACALKISWSVIVAPFSASSVSLSSLPPNAKSASIGDSVAAASAFSLAVIEPSLALCSLSSASLGAAAAPQSRTSSISVFRATVSRLSSFSSASAPMLATPAAAQMPSTIEVAAPPLAATALMVSTDAHVSSSWRFFSAAAACSVSCISLSRDVASAGSSVAASVVSFLSSFARFAASDASTAASTAA